MASSSSNWNLGRNNDIYCILAFWYQPNPLVLFMLEMVVAEANGIGGQLLIWFGSLVASWADLQWKVELNEVHQLGQFAHMSCFGWDFILGLVIRAEYFGGPLTWWFSLLEFILLLSHYEPYKMDKVTIYCHGFLFHMGFSC